jgi:hypothetical protein
MHDNPEKEIDTHKYSIARLCNNQERKIPKLFLINMSKHTEAYTLIVIVNSLTMHKGHF